MGLTQLGGTGYSRVVTKQNAAGSKYLGQVTVTGTGSTTSWGQINGSLAADSIITTIYVTCFGDALAAGVDNQVDIAVGGAGSEATIGTEPLQPSFAGTSSLFYATANIQVPLRIAAGQRIAGRVTTPSRCNGTGILITIYGTTYANIEGN